nr:DNA (cytosine-5)-methyltransferase 1-like [Ipomoea batatas]
MAYYQSPRKRAGSTSSRNEVSWIARATGITSEGDNPLYYYGMSINGVLVTPALLCWSTSLAGAGAPPFFRGIHVSILRRDKGCPWTSDGRGIQDSPQKQRLQEGALPDRELPRLPSLQRYRMDVGEVSIHCIKVFRSVKPSDCDTYIVRVELCRLVAILGLLKMGRTNVEKVENFVVNPLICEVNRGFTVPECVLFFLGFYCFAGMAMSAAQSYGFNL